MKADFIPIYTDDGTISLYNYNVCDVYHSKVGAYTEALHKFVIPSGLLDFVKVNNEVKILDVCFGLGYNSKVAVSEILKVNPNCRILINAFEIDPVVIAISCIISNEYISDYVEQSFFNLLSKQVDILGELDKYLNQIQDKTLNFEKNLPEGYKLVNQSEINQKLHNIYYQSISSRNSINPRSNTVNDLLSINVYLADARTSVKALNTQHDFIFHDPFTPSKAPQLWTVEYFKELFRLLNDSGNLTTYSSAAPVRSGLIESGFHVGRTEPVGKKTSGTIAYKSAELLNNYLTDSEKGILETTAGIPYYDITFQSSSDEILKNRELMQKNSDKISSSKFMKSKYKLARQ